LAENLLDIQGLVTVFPGEEGELVALDGLDLTVLSGEILGLVGESGCGKSLTALSVLGLVPPPGKVRAGRVMFDGEDLLSAPEERLREMRGAAIGMIFQEPMTSLNPVFTVGRQVAEAITAHQNVPPHQAWEQAVAALGRVGIPDPARRAQSFPHQLSGGMRQRVMIAMAMILNPRLLIADEPTTALDVTIQAQILGLMLELQKQSGAAVLLITHNLAVVAQTADRVAVMYTGRLVEEAKVADIFAQPLHPYTMGLLACLPSRSTQPSVHLPTIPGLVPALNELPVGCAFSDRCPQAFAPCREAEPALAEVAPGRRVRCFLHHQKPRQNRKRAA